MSTCTVCSREYEFSKKAGHTKSTCNTCIVNRRRRKITEMMLDYKGRVCSQCGYNKCTSALDYHHLDPSTKDFQISGNWGLSWERIRAELDKCVLLCSNCHREIHASKLL